MLLICCFAFVGCSTTKVSPPSKSAIAVTIPFDSYDWHEPFGYRHHDKFHVLLTNVSSKPVRVWQEWCSWGYYCLQIEIVEEDGTKHLLKRRPINFITNGPDYVELQPGGSVVWNVSLDPSVWEDLSWFPKGRMLSAKVRAIFTVEESKDEQDNRDLGVNRMGVWTGQAVSEFYDFTLLGLSANQSK